MAADNFDKSLTFTLQFEGGFVNDPRDPGGATNLGVTIGTLSGVLGRPATIADVRALTPKKVGPIYHDRYWTPVMGDDLPAGLDLAVFDFGVHSGPVRAIVSLQRMLGVGDDGKIGPLTIAAARALDPTVAIQRLSADRLTFLSHLSVFQAFGPGLKSRVLKCEHAALSMVQKNAADAVKQAKNNIPVDA